MARLAKTEAEQMRFFLVSASLLSGALAGCAGSTPTPSDTRALRDRPLYRSEETAALSAGKKEFGSGFDAEWRKLGGPETAIPAATSNASSSLTPEEREFQDWRAWQEWKRRNPK